MLQHYFVGPLEFSTRELISNHPYSEKIDIWSLGVAMLICQIGDFPWNEMKILTVILKICRKDQI
jgi:serine/threonine protein kinase